MKKGKSNNNLLSSKSKNIIKYSSSNKEHVEDIVSIEEPLEISISYGASDKRKKSPISVTMRTPGNDFGLALGFLFTEGIITKKDDIVSIRYTSGDKESDQFDNYILVDLRPELPFDENQLSRHFYTASSCGVCGKSSIELVNKQSLFLINPNHPLFSQSLFFKLPAKLRALQKELNTLAAFMQLPYSTTRVRYCISLKM